MSQLASLTESQFFEPVSNGVMLYVASMYFMGRPNNESMTWGAIGAGATFATRQITKVLQSQ